MVNIVNEDDAATVIENLKQKHFVILHTGCYEVLHAGHLACFKQAKSIKGAREPYLVVGVESDNTLNIN